MGRAGTTIRQDEPAFRLLNYFLVNILGSVPIDHKTTTDLEEEAEDILTGYSVYLRDTNIPRYWERYLDNENKAPKGHMDFASLEKYLGKVKNLLQKLVPNIDFWKDEEAIKDITGANFKRGCKRSQ